MRLYHVVFTVLPVLSSCLVSAGSDTIYARQPDDTMAVTISADQTAPVQPTPMGQTTTIPLQRTSSISMSMIDLHTSIANSQHTAVPSSTNATDSVATGALPLAPKITPALGVAAVVLITTGMVYSLIGNKIQWIHVFLSAAFLRSLSVTVLIVYVMSPPVSDAIQGGYFVAAFCTGAIFGAISLVFKELIEGLGCILGGFCLSMWILSLKTGSLLTSSGSRAIFISTFCAAAYALSFTSYTRPYALMASSAFAGSTATVLGIDCFSRAGLKEFWLYTWGLNDNIFPLNTATYPVTRGIRVELAITVILCLIGLLSQFHLGKAIHERRKRKASQQAEEERTKDEAEAELSRRLEEDKGKDLALWEAMFGTPKKSDRADKANVDDQVAEAEPDEELSTSQDISEGPRENGNASQNRPRSRNSWLDVTPLLSTVPVPRNSGADEDDHSIQANPDDTESVATLTSNRLSGASLLRRIANRKCVGHNHGSRMQSESKEMLVPVPPASSTSSGCDDKDEFDTKA